MEILKKKPEKSFKEIEFLGFFPYIYNPKVEFEGQDSNL